jgi:hypothetical protein
MLSCFPPRAGLAREDVVAVGPALARPLPTLWIRRPLCLGGPVALSCLMGSESPICRATRSPRCANRGAGPIGDNVSDLRVGVRPPRLSPLGAFAR